MPIKSETIIRGEELLKGLNEEQIAKLKECKTQEEMLTLAKEEGIELSDEQLAAVSGGCNTGNVRCPKCGQWAIRHLRGWGYVDHECRCGHIWSEKEGS